MLNKFLRSEQRKMSSAATDFVQEAADKASRMVVRESRGPGDLLNAMRRIEQRYGVPYSVLWSLRYRRPKDILVSVYARICVAYEVEWERQRKLLEHEAATANAKTGFGKAVVGEVQALVRQSDEAVK